MSQVSSLTDAGHDDHCKIRYQHPSYLGCQYTLSQRREIRKKKKKVGTKLVLSRTHTHMHTHIYQGRNQAVGKSPQADWLLQRDLN